MNFFSYIKEAFGTLTQNKMRSLLSLLGIVIGISSVVILTAIGNGMKASITKDLWTNQNVIKIQQWKISQWPSSWGFSENWSSSADDPLSEPSIEQKVAAEKIFSRDMIQLLEKVFAWRIKAIVPIMTFRTSTPTIIMGEESSAEIKVVENSFFCS